MSRFAFIALLAVVVTINAVGQYKEDLSLVRPTFEQENEVDTAVVEVMEEVVPEHHVNDAVQNNLDILADIYGEYRKTKGYRVQVYSGTSFEEAEDYRRKARIKIHKYYKSNGLDMGLMPQIYQHYDAPLFRVRIGDYIRRENSYRMLHFLKGDFPNGLLVPDNVLLDKI